MHVQYMYSTFHSKILLGTLECSAITVKELLLIAVQEIMENDTLNIIAPFNVLEFSTDSSVCITVVH
jgi:hypothetical protein